MNLIKYYYLIFKRFLKNRVRMYVKSVSDSEFLIYLFILGILIILYYFINFTGDFLWKKRFY